MYHRPSGCCGCVICYVFSICQGNSDNFEHKDALYQCWEGNNNMFIMILPSSPPNIGGVYFGAQNYHFALENTRYITYDTPTTPRRSMIHVLQILATYMYNTINIFYPDPKWVSSFALSLHRLRNSNVILTC